MVIGRLDHHSERLVKLEEGAVIIRQRINILEQDRESVREMVGMIGKLADKTDKAIDAVDEIAERAVSKVLKIRADERRQTWKHTLAMFSGACAAAGAAFGVVNNFFHLIHF